MTTPITAEATETQVTAAQYDLPACDTDLWLSIKGVFDLVISQLLGLAPNAAIAIVIILALALVVGALFEGARRPIVRTLLWVLAAAILSGFLITLATTLIVTNC